MEDRTTAIGDIFLPKTPRYIGNRRIGQDVTVAGNDSGSVEGNAFPSPFEGTGGEKKEGENTRGDESSMSPSAAFFAVYDGHDGDSVADVLHRKFHEVLTKQVSAFHLSLLFQPIPKNLVSRSLAMHNICLVHVQDIELPFL